MRDLRQILTRLSDAVWQKKTDSWRKKDSDLERQLSKRRIVDVCCAVTLAACACLAFWFSSTTTSHFPLHNEIQIQGWASLWWALHMFVVHLTHLSHVHREAQGWSRAYQTEVPRSYPCWCLWCRYRIGLLNSRVIQQVICEKADRTDIPTIDKKKYLVPSVCYLHSWSLESTSDRGFQGSYCWPIRLCHSEAYQACTWEGHFHFCRRSSAADSGPNECYIRRTQVSVVALPSRSFD